MFNTVEKHRTQQEIGLVDNGHNPGGHHAHYRALRALLYFFEDEAEPEDWNNPIKKSPKSTARTPSACLLERCFKVIEDL